MRLEDFNYNLPKELIAQVPSPKRDECRLMVLDKEKHTIEHKHFYDILDYLQPGDCLVVNDSRVIPARLFGIKEKTGAHIELLLIKRLKGDKWESLVKPGKRLKEGDTVILDDKKLFKAHIHGYRDRENGTRIIEFEYEGIFMERLEEIGSMPLPPYIERSVEDEDKERYQTVYSRIEGSVAAPTAGLHFTDELLKKVQVRGIELAYVTLHVGIGTFRPVKVDNIEDHKMHFEEYTISPEAAEVINKAKSEGRRIISVGTTSTRTLESAAKNIDGIWQVESGHSSTGIFIYPGYEYKIIDGLITNFHLPKSTLIMLVSALYDREHIMAAYEEAVEEKYKFFSYGDAMFIK